MERVTGERVKKTVRRPSIRSAEAEERKGGHGVSRPCFFHPFPRRPRTRSRRQIFGWFLITPETPFDVACLAELFGPAHQGIYPRFKFIQFEGFGEVVVSAEVQT